MLQFIHMTAAYSNAVLVAILPHFSDVAKKLDLPIAQPITSNQVIWLSPLQIEGQVDCAVVLTNHYWFAFNKGYVASFRSPNNYLTAQEIENPERYVGKDNMSTNEAIELARASFRNLGHRPESFRVDGPPSSVLGPFDVKNGHLPYCRIQWNSPESMTQEMRGLGFRIQFDIDLQHKQIVGMFLAGRQFWLTDPQIDVTPESESEYQQRLNSQISASTNSLPRETQRQVRPVVPLIHITAEYSNAALRATLPLVSDFARKLDLPVPQPLTNNQVIASHPSKNKAAFANILVLTNHYWFIMANGYVGGFSSPDNWFEEAETRTDWPRFSRKSCLTTNEAIELARRTFNKLGYEPKDYHLDMPPTEFENAIEDRYGKKEVQYAYCRISWDGPDREHNEGCQFDVDMKQKQVVGMVLISTNFWRPPPKIDVEPELESDYQKRIQSEMLVHTNAPPHWPSNQTTNESPAIPSIGGQDMKQE